MVPDNRRATQLDSGYYTKIDGTWTLKHEIISSKFYELIINTEIKGYTALEIKNF